jgi:hypothetical protein
VGDWVIGWSGGSATTGWGEHDDAAAGLAHADLVHAVEGAAAWDDELDAVERGGDGVEVGDLEEERGAVAR